MADGGRVDACSRRALVWRRFDQQRHPGDLLIHDRTLAHQTVRAHHIAVVRSKDDVGVFRGESVGGVDHTADLAVDKAVAAKVEWVVQLAIVQAAVGRRGPLFLVRGLVLKRVVGAWSDGVAIVCEFLCVLGWAGKGAVGLVVRDDQDKRGLVLVFQEVDGTVRDVGQGRLGADKARQRPLELAVNGEGAADEIVTKINELNKRKDIDLLSNFLAAWVVVRAFSPL